MGTEVTFQGKGVAPSTSAGASERIATGGPTFRQTLNSGVAAGLGQAAGFGISGLATIGGALTSALGINTSGLMGRLQAAGTQLQQGATGGGIAFSDASQMKNPTTQTPSQMGSSTPAMSASQDQLPAGPGMGKKIDSQVAFGAGALSLGGATGSGAVGVGSVGGSSGTSVQGAVGAASGGDGQSQLLDATKQMQETQMSFNLQYLQLQSQMQNENRSYTAVSNIMKTKHDTVKNSISNIR